MKTQKGELVDDEEGREENHTRETRKGGPPGILGFDSHAHKLLTVDVFEFSITTQKTKGREEAEAAERGTTRRKNVVYSVRIYI